MDAQDAEDAAGDESDLAPDPNDSADKDYDPSAHDEFDDELEGGPPMPYGRQSHSVYTESPLLGLKKIKGAAEARARKALAQCPDKTKGVYKTLGATGRKLCTLVRSSKVISALVEHESYGEDRVSDAFLGTASRVMQCLM